MDQIKVVFVFGGPGAGKSTICGMIENMLGIKHISVGEMIRSSTDPFIIQCCRTGKTVPSKIIVQQLMKTIVESGNDRILIDGFPRSVSNIATWDQETAMFPRTIVVMGCIYITCPDDVLTKRVLNRGRTGDCEEVVKKRLEAFHNKTKPVIEYFDVFDMVHRINGNPDIQEDAYMDTKYVLLKLFS